MDRVLKKRLASMSFEDAKLERDLLESRVADASAALQVFPRSGPMRLVPEDVRTSPAYRTALARYRTDFTALQQFNLEFTKLFAKELRAERDARFAERAARYSQR